MGVEGGHRKAQCPCRVISYERLLGTDQLHEEGKILFTGKYLKNGDRSQTLPRGRTAGQFIEQRIGGSGQISHLLENLVHAPCPVIGWRHALACSLVQV